VKKIDSETTQLTYKHTAVVGVEKQVKRGRK
jgi:hypothetical protein